MSTAGCSDATRASSITRSVNGVAWGLAASARAPRSLSSNWTPCGPASSLGRAKRWRPAGSVCARSTGSGRARSMITPTERNSTCRSVPPGLRFRLSFGSVPTRPPSNSPSPRTLSRPAKPASFTRRIGRARGFWAGASLLRRNRLARRSRKIITRGPSRCRFERGTGRLPRGSGSKNKGPEQGPRNGNRYGETWRLALVQEEFVDAPILDAAPGHAADPAVLDNKRVKKSYARWAPVYDLVFELVLRPGRKAAAAAADRPGGHVLDGGA